MTKPRVRLGMLTPSSNTALEPITSAMLSALPHVSAHFARFTVTEIALSEQALGQFDTSHILSAACQLADARVDVIAWNGTSAGWLGFERDVELCRQIAEATGIPATTSPGYSTRCPLTRSSAARQFSASSRWKRTVPVGPSGPPPT